MQGSARFTMPDGNGPHPSFALIVGLALVVADGPFAVTTLVAAPAAVLAVEVSPDLMAKVAEPEQRMAEANAGAGTQVWPDAEETPAATGTA